MRSARSATPRENSYNIPSVPDFFAMRDSVVIFEGRQYKFVDLSRDGFFVIRKRW